MIRSCLNCLKVGVLALVLAVFTTGCSNAYLPGLEQNPWNVVELPKESVLADIAFTDDPDHGWLVGSRSTLLETRDGGDSWTVKDLDLGDKRYTFTSVDFSGDEGWVTGTPSVLLHTRDGGESWESVPLSPKLPGTSFLVTALGPESVEMATDIGAIYVTENSGSNWKALVEGAVGVVRNMTRSEDGRYVAVSSRGNFYSTWAKGQREWNPHNRQNSRRLQNMGFDAEGKLWLIARGGQISFATSRSAEDFSKPQSPEFSTSWGLLDVAYRTSDELWVSGGGGTLLCSFDGGETWFKDREVGDVPTNLYHLVFTSPNRGFALGERGYLLKYEQSA